MMTKGTPSAHTSQAIKLMVVHADRHWLDIVADDLAFRGFAVTTALDGITAIERLEDWQPDVIVANVPMPRMNGLELVCWLRDRGCATPVILVDDPNDGIDDTLARLVGANRLFPRTGDVATLAAIIGELHDLSNHQRLAVDPVVTNHPSTIDNSFENTNSHKFNETVLLTQ